MGMDLVPVYAEGKMDEGTVKVAPGVAHNIGVRTAIVRRGQLEDELTTVAYVQYDEDQLWHAYPRVEGWLNKLYVQSLGEQVMVGEPLYEIYSPALVNAQEEFVVAMQSRNQTLINSSRERLEALEVPASYVEKIEKGGRVSQSITVRSRQDGIVSKLNVREGHYVTPGTEVMEIAGLDPVWVMAEIFESDAADVDLGDEMEIRFGYKPGEIHRASIDFVYPVLEAVTRTLQVRASLPNPDGDLKPNMFAEASIHLADEEDVLLVPREAVIRTGLQDRVVLAMNDDRFKSVEIKLGRVSATDAEVLSGLVEGDRVVTSAQFLIDSESSISSDFKRMDLAQAEGMDHSAMEHGGDAMEHGGEAMEHGGEAMEHGGEAMEHGGEAMEHGGKAMESKPMGKNVWTNGTLRSIDLENRSLSLTHEPIPEWSWPTMTMTMEAGKDVDLESLEPGAAYRFHIMEAPESAMGYVIMHAMEPDTADDPGHDHD
jgi:Cu(I)/Ag(I) efflux system membrane fusion protein